MSREGLSLKDIARLREEVKIGPGEDDFVKVHGISANAALALINKYPAILGKALEGGGVKFGDIIASAPGAFSSILAIGLGYDATDDEAIEDAGSLPLEIQMDILEAIGRLTFKNGFGPFVQRITDLARSVSAVANSGEVPDMRSPQASSS